MKPWPCLAAAFVLFPTAGCRRDPVPPTTSNPPATPVEQPAAGPAQLPTVDPPLIRRDVLLAVAEAASARASGTDDLAPQRKLDGRPFSFRIRLCGNSPAVRQDVDPATRVLRVAVTPDVDGRQPMVAATMGKEAIGFRVPRPWLLMPACPKESAPAAPVPADPTQPVAQQAPAPTAATPSTGGMVGIVNVVRPDEARPTRRAERPLALTRRLAENETPGPIDLVLEGRLRALPGGKVIACAGDGVSVAPDCLVAARIDRVRMRAADGTLLAEWSEF